MHRVARHFLYRQRSRLFARYRLWKRVRRGELPPNVNQITEQLFVGGFIDLDDWRLLFAQGITVDVNLQAERNDVFGPYTPDGYLWLPTMDHSAPSADAIGIGAAFVSAAVDAGKRVLIHCHAGKGRSALLCAATLVVRGMSVDAAWALVKRQRPIAGLHRAQRLALETFAATVQQERES